MAALTWGFYFNKIGDYFFGRDKKENEEAQNKKKLKTIKSANEIAVRYFCGPPLDEFEAARRAIYVVEGNLADVRAAKMRDALNHSCAAEFAAYKASQTQENLIKLIIEICKETRLPSRAEHMGQYIRDKVYFEERDEAAKREVLEKKRQAKSEKQYEEKEEKSKTTAKKIKVREYPVPYACPETFYYQYSQQEAKRIQKKVTIAQHPLSPKTPGPRLQAPSPPEIKHFVPPMDRATQIRIIRMKSLQMPTTFNVIGFKFFWPPYFMHAVLRPIFYYPAKYICKFVNYVFGNDKEGRFRKARKVAKWCLKGVFAGGFIAGDILAYSQAQIFSYNGIVHIGKSAEADESSPAIQSRTPQVSHIELSAMSNNRVQSFHAPLSRVVGVGSPTHSRPGSSRRPLPFRENNGKVEAIYIPPSLPSPRALPSRPGSSAGRLMPIKEVKEAVSPDPAKVAQGERVKRLGRGHKKNERSSSTPNLFFNKNGSGGSSKDKAPALEIKVDAPETHDSSLGSYPPTPELPGRTI